MPAISSISHSRTRLRGFGFLKRISGKDQLLRRSHTLVGIRTSAMNQSLACAGVGLGDRGKGPTFSAVIPEAERRKAESPSQGHKTPRHHGGALSRWWRTRARVEDARNRQDNDLSEGLRVWPGEFHGLLPRGLVKTIIKLQPLCELSWGHAARAVRG